jgi:L-ascorbate metabolism protein UlaG (beta-lactamase superfamily)
MRRRSPWIRDDRRITAQVESVTYIGHATVRLDVGGARLLTDPFLRDRIGHLTRRSPSVPPEAYADLDGVLISHLHLDHFDVPSLRRIARGVPVLVPRGGGPLLRRIGFTRVHEVVAEERVRIGGTEVVAVPAVHGGRRRPGPGGADADALGYVAAGAARVYFAGDTDLYEEMARLAPVDVALLPVWGWGPSLGAGHMDPEAAARALPLLRPRTAIPIHWGTLFPVGFGRFRGDRLTDPPHEFARHAARLAPEVKVEVLQPGARIEVADAA